MAMAVTLDQRYTGPLVIESYLKKLKKASHRAVFSSKFTKRWFVLDLRSGSFHYLQNKNKTRPERAYTLSDILSVDINPKVIEVCDWKFSFVVETADRSYFLYAESVSMHTLWCTALLALVRVPVGEPPQPNNRPAYEHYQDREYANPQPQGPAQGDPRQQEYDPEARTPSPVQDSRYPAYPPPQYQSQQPEQPPDSGQNPPQTQAEAPSNPPPEQPQEAPQEQVPEPPKQAPREPQEPRAPRQQIEPREPPQVPQGTFVRVMEEVPQAAPRAKPTESQLPESDEFEIQTPSRFSTGRKGPAVGESSYKGPETRVRSIWADNPVEAEGVIKVEKMVPDVTAKEEVRNIKRERHVKKEEKPKEEPRPPPKTDERLRPQPQPRPEPVPPTDFKESLNLGKGGFTDILDEMHNLSLPPADDMPKSIWGGGAKVPKEKKAKEPPAPVYRPEPSKAAAPIYEPAKVPAPIYEPARKPAQPSYEPVPSYSQAPEPPASRSTYESDPRRPAYNPQPPAYQEAPRASYEASRPAYNPQPPAYQEAPRAGYEASRPAYNSQPPAYQEAPRPAYNSQPPAYQEAPRAPYEASRSSYNPQPPAYQEVPRASYEAPRNAYVPPQVYREKPKEQPGQYVGKKYAEKPAGATAPQNYDDWDDEAVEHHTGPSTGPAQQPPAKKQGLNWDDWDQE